jgi:hypothetical protein
MNKLVLRAFLSSICSFHFQFSLDFSLEHISFGFQRIQITGSNQSFQWFGNNLMDKAPGLLFFATSQGG